MEGGISMTPSEQKLLNLLSNNDITFFIPPYQRNYEWTKEQCDVFLKDIVNTYAKNSKGDRAEHFFGTITFFQTQAPLGQPNKIVLIDGQQRITTTMLFLAALRDSFEDESLKTFINNKYLKNINVVGEQEDQKIKLKQVEADWDAYKNIILKRELTTEQQRAPVYKNYRWFLMKLQEIKNDEISLNELFEKGIDKFSVVTIELNTDNEWENPQEIFETMNSLGKPLSLADLVRNYLLLGLEAEKQTEYYHKYWLKIEKTIPGEVSNFIRDYMQTITANSHKLASENNYKELYSTFKSIFNETPGVELLQGLSKFSDYYAYILAVKSTGNAQIDKAISDLHQVNNSTTYSFLMALISEWKDKGIDTHDLLDIIEVLKIYIYRRRLLGINGQENQAFPSLINLIPRLVRAKNKKNEMFFILSKQNNSLRLPNDIELKRALETMNFYNFKYCKYFLALIEEALTKSRPCLTDHILQIEHIMPQTLSKEWKQNLGINYDYIHQNYLNDIGNLTLIRHNQNISNKTFAEKKNVFLNYSGLQIAKTKVIDKNHWDAETIKERREWIINFILNEVVPIPNEMRRTNNFRIQKTGKLSFEELQLIGVEIHLMIDPKITAIVCSDKEVVFEGKKMDVISINKRALF